MPAKLLLVGDGPEKHRVTDLVKVSPYKDDILFLGKQENITELFAISDLKLLLSEKESFGLVLLEAMACGVPGIGTAIGGIPEVINHGVNGYLVPLGDTQSVADYAVELLQDEVKHAAFKLAALQAVREQFHESKMVEQYERIYERVVQEKMHWQAAKKVINTIEQAGFEAYIVGGAVRDYYLKKRIMMLILRQAHYQKKFRRFLPIQ